MDSVQAQVDAIFERPPEQGVSLAMVVMHRGGIVAERYGIQPANVFEPEKVVTADSTLCSWSVAKSMVHAAVGVILHARSGHAVDATSAPVGRSRSENAAVAKSTTHAAGGILVRDGALDLEAPAAVPEWKGTDKEAVTVLDLLEMRPGLRFVEDYVDGETSHCIAMLFGEGAADHAAYAAALPLDHPPGTVWNYSSGTTNILCRILGDVVGGGREGMESFLRDRLFDPADMTSAIPKFDDAGTWVGSSYVYATARDFARFGELYRHDGVTADGERILPEGWADHGRTKVAHEPTDDLPSGFDYGRHWWMWPGFPGSIAAHGYEGQYVVVVPDRELTVVHLGKTPADRRRHVVAGIDSLIRHVDPTA